MDNKNIQEQKNKKNNLLKVSSIARKISIKNVLHLFGSYLWMDVLLVIGMTASFVYGLDLKFLGDFSLTRYRSLAINDSIHNIIYTVGLKGDGDFYQIDIGEWVYIFSVAGCIFAGLQIWNLFREYFNGVKRVRHELRPLNELALKAYQLSNISFDDIQKDDNKTFDNKKNKEIKIDETKYHNLEDAITKLKVEKPDAKIHVKDKELQGIESAVNDLLDRMRESYRLQTQFVSDASHELRTPIAVIQGYVNMLDRWGKDDEEVLNESIEAIKNEANHMQKLVEQLLFLARGDSNRQKLDMKVQNLNAIMQEVFEEYLMIDEKHKYSFKEEGCAWVYGDIDMLKQSARILIDNSVKYTSENGKIDIKVGVNLQGKAFYSVQDEGIGMSENDVQHIFDRFYRADSVRNSSTGGTGLGLAIAKWIVDKHEGYYEIVSREQLGTRIIVYFDACSEHDNMVKKG